VIRSTLLFVAAVVSSLGCERKERSSAERAAMTAVNPDDPRPCGSCHATVVEEWRQSMHSRADHRADPIYAALRELRSTRQGDASVAECAQCHNPRSPDNLERETARVGVGCAACHNVQTVHSEPGKFGARAIERGVDNRMVGPHDLEPGVSPGHATGPSADFIKDGRSLCLACHAARDNPQGVSTCTTGFEHAAHQNANATCVSCHMPRVDSPAGAVNRARTHASHAFIGPHRAWYQDDVSLLASAIKLSATLGEGTLEVTLDNRSGHGFPTGFPGRMAVLTAVGKDATGAPVWRNYETDAARESPASVLNKVYVDGEGKPVMPPFAAELKRDNRLKPDEVRALDFVVPAAVVTVELSLAYRLLPPPAAKTLGLQDALEAEPRVIIEHTVRAKP